VAFENPAFIPGNEYQRVWETVVDVAEDYFRIEREEPVRLVGNVLTEGRLYTFPETSSTYFEPWRRDTADPYDRLEATLQTLRRRAEIRVLPAEGGFWVDVAVYKELEDLVQPEMSTAGAATFPTGSSQVRVINPVGGQETHAGWICKGRDPNLEEQMVCQIRARLSGDTPIYIGPVWQNSNTSIRLR
jgi:hypothetical protein